MEPELSNFLQRVGPLMEGLMPTGSKIHAVRANSTRSWCGRHGIEPGKHRWTPGNPNNPDVYCGQCLAVWQAATARNQQIKGLLTGIERVILERRIREHSRAS